MGTGDGRGEGKDCPKVRRLVSGQAGLEPGRRFWMHRPPQEGWKLGGERVQAGRAPRRLCAQPWAPLLGAPGARARALGSQSSLPALRLPGGRGRGRGKGLWPLPVALAPFGGPLSGPEGLNLPRLHRALVSTAPGPLVL